MQYSDYQRGEPVSGFTSSMAALKCTLRMRGTTRCSFAWA